MAFLQETATTDAAAALMFSIGDKIEARYGGEDAYYPGIIGFVHADAQTADIAYDDGDGEAGVPFALIRKAGAGAGGSSGGAAAAMAIAVPSSSTTPAVESKFSIGTAVEVRGFKGGWSSGTIAVVRDEGSFDVQLDSGTIEKGVPPSLVRLKEEAAAEDNNNNQSSSGNNNNNNDNGAGVSAAPISASDATASALLSQISPATKKERELKEELEMLVKAEERQQRSVDKNTKTIASLKLKIAELEATFGPADGGTAGEQQVAV